MSFNVCEALRGNDSQGSLRRRRHVVLLQRCPHTLWTAGASLSISVLGSDKCGRSDSLYWRTNKDRKRMKFRVCLISFNSVSTTRTQQSDVWHVCSVLSLPDLGTVNNHANWTDRTLLAPSVSVLLQPLLLFSLIEGQLKASIRSDCGQYSAHFTMRKCFSGSCVAQVDSERVSKQVDNCVQNKNGDHISPPRLWKL